jgi:hypothetical protein
MDKHLELTPEEKFMWDEIVYECRNGHFSTINVASKTRSETIIKVDGILSQLAKLSSKPDAELVKVIEDALSTPFREVAYSSGLSPNYQLSNKVRKGFARLILSTVTAALNARQTKKRGYSASSEERVNGQTR